MCFFFFWCFLRQGCSVALEPVLKLALIDQTGLELTEIHYLCLLSSVIEGVYPHYPMMCEHSQSPFEWLPLRTTASNCFSPRVVRTIWGPEMDWCRRPCGLVLCKASCSRLSWDCESRLNRSLACPWKPWKEGSVVMKGSQKWCFEVSGVLT